MRRIKSTKNLTAVLIISLTFISAIFALPVFAFSTDGTIDLTYKYTWGENIGWLNFGTTEGNIHVTDSALTGYIWAENIGWISLNCSNNNSCSTIDYKVSNNGEGALSGYAWSENTGWINFNPTYGGVTINSSGEFLGYAWGENVGWIVFNCGTTNSCGTVDYKVKTDWRPRSARSACNNSSDDDGDGKIDYLNDPGCSSLDDTDETDPGGGGLPPEAYNLPALPPSTSENPEGKFNVFINNGDEYADSQTVNLKLSAGPDTKRMSISNSFSFENASQIPYQEKMEWELPPISNDEFLISNQAPISNNQASKQVVERTVYAKFYTQYGVASEVVSDSINLIFEKSKPAVSPKSEPASSSALPETPIPSPALPMPAIPPVSPAEIPSASPAPPAQLPEQPPAPIPSKPAVEEPKTPPSSSEPSEPPMPAEPVQPKSTKEITSKSSEQPSFAKGFWQSVKVAFKNISSAITGSFSNTGKKIANLFNQGQNNFAVFLRDVKILESEIKIAVFESQSSLQISDIKVIPISSTSVKIMWQTNHKATSKVNYGLSRIYNMEKQNSKKIKNHSVILTNLSPNTTYHYEVISQNGSYVYDADRIFTTAEE